MANICIYYLFFSYAAAAVIYFILGIFASTGNVALLVEHYQLNENKTDILPTEPEDVKSRTYAQYYLGSILSIVISGLLFFFFIRGKNDALEPYTQTQSMESLQSLDIQQQNNVNTPNNEIMNELAQPMDPNSENIIQTINTNTSEGLGMGENEI